VADVLTLWRASVDAPQLFERLLHAPWSVPVQLTTAATALAVIVAMHARRFAWARGAVMLQVTLVVVAWGIAMDGHLVLPDVRYDDAGALPQVTGPLMWALVIGSLLVVPSLYLLFRVFKTRTGTP
jgi:cytochrome bd ubiquinol oxidase subunit II